MQQRSPIQIAILGFLTLGIYEVYVLVKTKTELIARGADIPTAWWLLVPIGNIWWMWKYSEGVEKVVGVELSAVLAFVLLYLLGPIGQAIIQSYFNKIPVAAVSSVSTNPVPPPVVPASPVTPA